MPGCAAIGGASAAAVLGAPTPVSGAPVTVIVPPSARWAGPRGIRVHRADLAPTDVVTTDDGVRHTVPLRTAWDLAALERTTTAVGVLDAMVRQGLVDMPALQGLVTAGGGRWGSRRVRRSVGLVDPRAESPPESWVRVACALAGLPAPVPQFAVVHGGEFLGRVDLAWPEHRLIVEYEGGYHFDGVQIAKDDARIARLIGAGWRVIRVAAHDLRDLDELVGRVAQALREARLGAFAR